MNPSHDYRVQLGGRVQIENHIVFPQLDKILEAFKPKNKVHFTYTVGPVTTKPKPTDTMLEINITNEQKVNVTLHPVTESGNPAQLDGVPTWEVVSGDSTVTAADDGLSADLISANDPGDTDFIVKADADLGSGVQEISDIIRLHVAGAMAANLGLVAGTPSPK